MKPDLVNLADFFPEIISSILIKEPIRLHLFFLVNKTGRPVKALLILKQYNAFIQCINSHHQYCIFLLATT